MSTPANKCFVVHLRSLFFLFSFRKKNWETLFVKNNALVDCREGAAVLVYVN